MSNINSTGRSIGCEHWSECDEPATWLALCDDSHDHPATPRELNVGIGAFCGEHIADAVVPDRDLAELATELATECCDGCPPAGWTELMNAYPNPIPMSDVESTTRCEVCCKDYPDGMCVDTGMAVKCFMCLELAAIDHGREKGRREVLHELVRRQPTDDELSRFLRIHHPDLAAKCEPITDEHRFIITDLHRQHYQALIPWGPTVPTFAVTDTTEVAH